MIIEAMRALSRNLVRSGSRFWDRVAVAIVITVIRHGRASIEASEAEPRQAGDNLVWVEAGSRNVSGARTGTHGMTTLIAHDADAIRRRSAHKDVSENVDGSFLVILQEHNWRTRWRGVAPSYQASQAWELANGAFLDDEQTDSCSARGRDRRDRAPRSCLPTSIRSARRCASRISASRSSACSRPRPVATADQDDTVMMPWTTAMKRIVAGIRSGSTISVLRDAPRRHQAGRAQLSEFARQPPQSSRGARTTSTFATRGAAPGADQTSNTLRLLLLGLASIAMAIGGIA